MNGKRTSIYLSPGRVAAIEASGQSLLDIIDAGLNAIGAAVDDTVAGAAEDYGRTPNCPHPKPRRQKGLCMLCGRYVG